MIYIYSIAAITLVVFCIGLIYFLQKIKVYLSLLLIEIRTIKKELRTFIKITEHRRRRE